MPTTGIRERIAQLVAEAPSLISDQSAPRRLGWLTAAQNAVQSVCPSSNSPYYIQANELTSDARKFMASLRCVREMVPLLERLLEEIDGGLLTSIENRAIALTFDNFLDHGEAYLKHRRKDEAGVIAGIVFEDTVRRICRVLSVPENGIPLDTLISELTKQNVLTAVKATRARAAARLRTSAAHAQWEEFEVRDVGPVIEFTRELIKAHLLSSDTPLL
jgi:hypothetical protein